MGKKLTPAEIKRYEAEAKSVTIIRDDYGVPHIYGKTDADAVFGLMYVQCEDNFKGIGVSACLTPCHMPKLWKLVTIKLQEWHKSRMALFPADN